MHKRITFRNMPHSDVMEQYANQQLGRIEQFLQENDKSPIYIDLVLEPSKIHEHNKIKLTVKSPRFDLHVGHECQEGEKFYDLLDRIIDRMYFLLHEENKKQIDERKTVGRHDEFKKQR